MVLLLELSPKKTRMLSLTRKALLRRQKSGRLQFKASPASSLQDPISKKPIRRKGWWSGSRCRPCVQAPVLQKKERKKGKKERKKRKKEKVLSIHEKSTP
jgi:hypothetical protein